MGSGVATAGAGAIALFATADLDQVKMASGVYRQGVFRRAGSELRSTAMDKTATISIKRRGSRVSIRTTGNPTQCRDGPLRGDDAGRDHDDGGRRVAAGDETRARRAAVIGLGSGLTKPVLLGQTRLDVVDTIEIERMVDRCRPPLSPRNDRAYRDRGATSNRRREDVLRGRSHKYDIIVSERPIRG